MQIHRGFQVHRPEPERTDEPGWSISFNRGEGIRDTRIQAQNETGESLKPWPGSPGNTSKLPSLSRICSATCDVLEVTPIAFKGDRRNKELVYARHIAYYLCGELTQKSYPDIGRFVNRDHTSVMYGHKKVRRRLEHGDPDLMEAIQAVMARLASAS